MRADAELEAILRAKKETERIQAEMLVRSTNELRDNVPDGAQQTAGQKRKSIHSDRAEDRVNGNAPRKIAKSHNRSRTMGHAEELFDSLSSAPSHISAPTNAAQPLSSIYSGRPTLDGPGATKDLRRSLSGRKDTTRTDYFRLKALGIDPNTPIVPDTKSSLKQKRQREEDDNISTTRTRARTLSSTIRPPVPQFPSPEAAASRTYSQNQSWTPPRTVTQTATNSSATQVDDDDDELLREARKVREAFSSGIEWFKTQAASIEKEVQDEFRRSASQTSSRSNPHPSANGLARSNGYEYLPGPGTAGRNLSRTEERIRRTGAHGLATKPIGGSGGYLAVAMSRDSAAKLNVERQSQATPEVPHIIKKTRKGTMKMSENNGRYVPQQSDESSEDFEDDAEESRLEPHPERQSQSPPRVVGIVKKTRKGKRKMGERDDRYIPRESDEDDEDSEELEGDVESNGLELHAEPPTNGKPTATEVDHHRSKTSEEPPEEYDDAQEDVDDVRESLEQGQYTEYDQFEGGDTEDLYEDGDDEEEQYDLDEDDGEGDGEGEEEEEEEEEADEVGALPNPHELKGQGQPVGGYWLRSSVTPERGLTPNGGGQMMSRASSGMGTGTGASVDDALVLDSD